MAKQFRQIRLLNLALILVLAIGASLWLRHTRNSRSQSANAASLRQGFLQETMTQLAALETEEGRIAESIWAREMLAQRCGSVFDQLWDRLNAADDKFTILGQFPVPRLIAGKWSIRETLPHGIGLHRVAGALETWNPDEWMRRLDQLRKEGWEITQTECRHIRFEADEAGRPRLSVFTLSVNLVNAKRKERATLEGDLVVDWTGVFSPQGEPLIDAVDTSALVLKTRSGDPPFQLVHQSTETPPHGSYFIDPLIVHDLDGDGTSEIILASANLVLKWTAQGGFERRPLFRDPPRMIFTALIADFTGDGVADFLCAKFEGLVLYKGDGQGAFLTPGQTVWRANPRLKYAQVLTCGDIDADGDLDVWLGQYKTPYEQGQMPTPFHNANDAYPSFLLVNDGTGVFTDQTEKAGLDQKRWRRSYSGSFVDLDADGDLDLMVMSDFAGVDLYQNDGHGHFTDVTSRWVDNPRAAGMAHAIADFNRDGLIDLLMMGMHSPTVDRLDHLGLYRWGRDSGEQLRTELMHGNRLYFGQRSGGYRETSASQTIARSGWSWGCTAFDMDNDGFPDVYIANGHETRQSVQDYESEMWLHDIYIGTSRENPLHAAYFGAKFGRTRARGFSYGGYDKNRLYLNLHGEGFLEVGHLFGVALEQDSRCAVAEDFDGDGRMDLLVTTFEAWPETKQTIRIYRNTLDSVGNWIGFRFREEGGGVSPVGTTVTLHTAQGNLIRPLVTGDSYRSQHGNTLLFGLRTLSDVQELEIRSVGAKPVRINQPQINRYNEIRLRAP